MATTDPKTDTADALEEIERLRYKNPDYEIYEAFWQFYLIAYEGGPLYVQAGNLFKHQREHIDDFNDRLQRATYANYCQPLVDFVPEFIYSQGVQRRPPERIRETFDEFIKNVDRTGTAIDAFMEEVAGEARIFGHTWVGIDKPLRPSTDRELSAAEAKSLGLDVPYLFHVRPLEVLDWVRDSFGNFLYLKRRDYYWERKGKTPRFRHIERYTEWYPDQCVISRIDITDEQKLMPKKRIDNAWGVIPFVQFFYKRSKLDKDMGVSFLADIAYQNREIFNLTSQLNEFLSRQCFNFLALETSSSVPTRDRQDGRIGTSNVLWVPKGTTMQPEYVSPPVDPAAFIQSEREVFIKEMYRQAAQDIMAEVFAGGEVPSADAQKQAFARTIPMIAKMADLLQFGEQRLWTIWTKMQGQKWDTGTVAYRDDYSVTNVQDLLLQLSTILNNLKVLSPTFIREEWKRVIREFDGKIEKETLQAIHDEIDKMSDDELVEGYKPPMGDIKAAPGVPSTANVMQGRAQKSLGTDRKISMATGNRASTKEASSDSDRKTAGTRKQR